MMPEWRSPAPGTTRLLRDLDPRRFDGNLSDDVYQLLVADETWKGLSADQLETLMQHTKMGNLSWVLVPQAGYRL